MRIERIGLKNHRDVAFARREIVRHFAADQDAAFGDILEPRHHPERRRFAATRRTDEHQELAVGDGNIEPADGLLTARIALGHRVEDDFSHKRSMCSSRRVLGRIRDQAVEPARAS